MGKSNYDIAHAFAYGATSGKSCNMFIEDDCIYSYGHHFCIAKRIDEGTILMTTRGYSNSTASHISYVKSACSHKRMIYCYDPAAWSHNTNQDEFLRDIKALLPSLAKARKPEKWIHEIQVICERAKTYCEFFNIKMDKDLAKFVNSEDFNKTSEEYLAELKKRAERERRKQMKEHKEYLAKWHKFEFNHSVPFLEYQELRMNTENKNRIETTMGVTITYDMGKEFYEKLKAGEVKEGDQLLYYRVGKIDNKEIRIGCHKFKMKYLLDFGKRVF